MELTEVEKSVLSVMIQYGPSWFFRAIDPSTPTLNGKTIFSYTNEIDGKNFLYPSIRMKDGKLKDYDEEAFKKAVENQDYVILPDDVDPEFFSKTLSDVIDKFRKRSIDGN
tara:strand:+ start:664 stop:996 length:333 start_codon:yes stop_codon:yes gene_type:complete